MPSSVTIERPPTQTRSRDTSTAPAECQAAFLELEIPGKASAPKTVQTVPPPSSALREKTPRSEAAEAQYASVGGLKQQPKELPYTTITEYKLENFDPRYCLPTEVSYKIMNGELHVWGDPNSKPNNEDRTKWVRAADRGIISRYYADGRLYNEKGEDLGAFGIDGDARAALGKSPILNTFGTLEKDGVLLDFNPRFVGYTKQEGGIVTRADDRKIVIRMGPPPGLERAFVPIIKDLMVDGTDTHFRVLPNQVAYEVRWLPAGEARSFNEQSRVDPSKIAPSTDGWRYAGPALRFGQRENGSWITQRILDATTNWRLSLPGQLTRLEHAALMWMQDPEGFTVEGPKVLPTENSKPGIINDKVIEKGPTPRAFDDRQPLNPGLAPKAEKGPSPIEKLDQQPRVIGSPSPKTMPKAAVLPWPENGKSGAAIKPDVKADPLERLEIPPRVVAVPPIVPKEEKAKENKVSAVALPFPRDVTNRPVPLESAQQAKESKESPRTGAVTGPEKLAIPPRAVQQVEVKKVELPKNEPAKESRATILEQPAPRIEPKLSNLDRLAVFELFVAQAQLSDLWYDIGRQGMTPQENEKRFNLTPPTLVIQPEAVIKRFEVVRDGVREFYDQAAFDPSLDKKVQQNLNNARGLLDTHDGMIRKRFDDTNDVNLSKPTVQRAYMKAEGEFLGAASNFSTPLARRRLVDGLIDHFNDPATPLTPAQRKSYVNVVKKMGKFLDEQPNK